MPKREGEGWAVQSGLRGKTMASEDKSEKPAMPGGALALTRDA